ncbi:MAG: DinB family protein [Lunatimonas sp.]|uniref:DinB family protein n=1 Tax=Lunatimonas sp. TaxID=2060141 RepID=UPI00263A59D8|nr:DinB family protein [Lunatimonas sp.]MCC5938113.1 DinB family protein [Lunatimonas sp.]
MKEIADQWQMQLTELGWAFEQTLKDLPPTDFNWKPQPDVWSIAEIVDHLIRVNHSYFPTFERILSNKHQKPVLGYVPLLGSKMGDLILGSMKKPDKVKTFAPWEPSGSLLDPRILRDFYELQHELSAYIQKLDPYFETNLMISSPLNRWIVYPLDTVIQIILAHESRHLAQIKQRITQLPHAQ